MLKELGTMSGSFIIRINYYPQVLISLFSGLISTGR